jgi:hypothetical protein
VYETVKKALSKLLIILAGMQMKSKAVKYSSL